MVNTGRPSGACGVCRERRIKCDETKPACLKCIRSGRTCSGYCHGLKLRDQTQKTIIKAKLGKPRGRRQNGGQDTGKKGQALSDTSSPTTRSPKEVIQRPRSNSLGLPADSDFGSVSSQGVSRGHLRRNSTSTASDYYDFWPLEAQMADGMASDSLHWQNIHTPLVEKARCYFLSSQFKPLPPPPQSLSQTCLVSPEPLPLPSQSARHSSAREACARIARASWFSTRNHREASSDDPRPDRALFVL